MSSPIEVEALIACVAESMVPGAVGLNIGCGNRQIGDSLGLDVKPAARAAVIVADARRLPVRSESLDYIVSCHCLEHLRDGPLPVLREWVRCLKVGAPLAVSVPNGKKDPDGMLLYQVPHGRTIPGQHVHLFTQKSLCTYMRCAGLTDVEAKVVHREPYWRSTVIVASGFRSVAFRESPYQGRVWTWAWHVLRDVPWWGRLCNAMWGRRK